MKQKISLEELCYLLRQLGKTHPAPHLDAKVVEMYREWCREQGKKGGSVKGRSRH